MLPDPRKTLARRIADELLTQGDLTIADVVFAPNLRHHGLASLTPGIAGVRDCTRILRQTVLDLSAIVEEEIAEEDRVVLRMTLSGTRSTSNDGNALTGAQARCQWVMILRLGTDGKVMHLWVSPDLVAVLQQLNANPVAAHAWDGDPTEEALR